MDFFLRYFSHIGVSVEMCDVDIVYLYVIVNSVLKKSALAPSRVKVGGSA